jgi:N4-gp56 family major capsid protein
MTLVGKFMGTGPDAVVQVKDDLTKGPGDRIRTTLSMLLSGDGVSGNTSLEGNEEALTYHTDDVNIDQLRNAVRNYVRIDSQRVAHDVREDAKVRLRDWWADVLDRSFINQLTGNTAETDNKKTGLNDAIDPDSDHIVWPGAATAVSDLVTATTHSFHLGLIDEALTKIKMFNEDSSIPQIRPMKGGYFGCIISPHQAEDLALGINTQTAGPDWQEIMQWSMQGGRVDDNPLINGSLGVYKNVVFYEDSRVPKGHNSGTYDDNTRVATLFGAQALCAAFGREGGRPDRFLWNEESFDYGNQQGVSASLIFGMKKVRFNSDDFGVITIPTYSSG